MPPVVMMFGLYATLTQGNDIPKVRRWGPILFLAGFLFFILTIFIIQPHLTKGLSFNASNYWPLYKNLGNTPVEIIQTVLLNPQTLFSNICTHKNMLFLIELFGPLIVPALLSPLVLLLGLPVFLQNLLSSFTGQQSIFYYYASTMTVFIFLAAIKTLGRLPQRQRRSIATITLFSVFIFNSLYWKEWKARFPHFEPALIQQTHQLLALIPENAEVISTYRFLPALSQRRQLTPLGRSRVSFTRKAESVPPSVTYAVFNPNDPYSHNAASKSFLAGPQWSVRAVTGDTILLQKDLPGGKPLISFRTTSTVSPTPRPVLSLGKKIALVHVEIPSTLKTGSRLLTVLYSWKILHDLTPGIRVRITIKQNDRTIWSKDRYIAYALPRRKTESINEKVFYAIPDLLEGNHTVEVQIVQDIEQIVKNPDQQSGVHIQTIIVR